MAGCDFHMSTHSDKERGEKRGLADTETAQKAADDTDEED